MISRGNPFGGTVDGGISGGDQYDDVIDIDIDSMLPNATDVDELKPEVKIIYTWSQFAQLA